MGVRIGTSGIRKRFIAYVSDRVFLNSPLRVVFTPPSPINGISNPTLNSTLAPIVASARWHS